MRAAMGKHRWVTIIVAAGIAILLVGTVMATVVLTYNINNNSAVNVNSHYDFVSGGNYATAHTLGIITNTISAPANQISTTLAGIQFANVEVYDVIEFDVSLATTTTSHVTAVSVVNAAAVAPAGVVCAYAFVSDAVPTAGTAAVAGEPAGCLAVTPTLGAIASACTVAGSATGVATINLLAGTVAGTPGTCNVANGAVAGLILEYVCFAIYVNAAVAATALNTVGIDVGAP
jgi:hypothetical protein